MAPDAAWRSREPHLDAVPGFKDFHLLRGPSDDEATLFASHSIWDSREAFEAWTESEAFRKAHAQARTPAGVLQGPPRLQLFEAVIEQ